MNATTHSHVQALPPATAGANVLFITEKSQSCEISTSGNQDAEELTLRATKMTQVLKNILEHQCYTHGGLND